MILKTETGQLISETSVVCGQSKYIGIHALASAVNSIAAAGAVCLGVDVQITLPVYAYKSKFNAIEKVIKETCLAQGIEELSVRRNRHPAVALPFVTVTGLAGGPKEQEWCRDKGRAGQDIVLTKWIGMDGMLQIAEEKETELKTRFAPAFMKQILSYRPEIFALKEIEVAKAMGVSAMHQITEGGVLAALWNLAKETETGLVLDLKQISVLQETVEVCEHFRLNPYQLTSVGSLLMVTDNGTELADALQRLEIEAAVIGRTTDNHDKIIQNGEEIRYIDRPAPDEILKIFSPADAKSAGALEWR